MHMVIDSTVQQLTTFVG